jgi:hypothetical protein
MQVFATNLMAADYAAEPIAQAVQLAGPAPVTDSGLNIQGLVSETGTFDSNPLMLTQGAKPLYGSTTSPEIILNDSTPSLQLNSDTVLNGNAFNQADFDSVDAHSAATLIDKGEVWSAGIQEKTDYDTTRTSELSQFDLTTRPFRHLGFDISPQISISPSEIDKFTLNGSYAVSNYQNNIFSDYNIYSISPTYVHNFDPTNAGVFALQAQHYETTDNLKNKIDTVGPSFGWITALTPNITGKITAGAQATRQFETGIATMPWDIQYIFSADVTFKGEKNISELVASRSEYPYGNGTEALLTSLTATEAYQLNQSLTLNFGAGFELSNYQITQTGDLQRELTGNVGFTYAINDLIDIKTVYQFSYETLVDVSRAADDHLITVSLTYRINPRPL